MKNYLIVILCLLLTSCFKINDISYQGKVSKIDLNNSKDAHRGKIGVMGAGADSATASNETNFYQTEIEYSQACDANGICGKKHNPEQLNRILNAVNSSEKQLMVVIFIHGWNHNASNESRNYQYFPNFLSRIDDQLQRKKIIDPSFDVPQVLGVYVGWPGSVENKNKVSRVLSVGNRGCAADKISIGIKKSCKNTIYQPEESEMKKDILEIINQVKSNNKNSKILIMGHSFGGRIVSNLFLNELNMAITNNKPNILGENVLISTINPATGFKKFSPIIFKQGQANKPYWINFTSTKDKATKYLFPLARLLVLHDQGIKTIGHKTSYLTHDLTVRHDGLWACNQKLKNESLVDCWQKDREIIKQLPINFNWYQNKNTTFEWNIAFFERKRNSLAYTNYKPNSGCLNKRENLHACVDVELYKAKIISKNRDEINPLFYNISTENNVIGFDDYHQNKHKNIDANHNGYISSVLTKLLMDRLYDNP